MKIAIPSYDRHNSITTIDTLKRHGIDLANVYLFLANEEQKELYKVPDEIHVVVGVLGSVDIRNFIINYFDDGEIIVWLDDDIDDFIILEKSLNQVLDDSIEYLKNSPYQLLGFPPTDNKYFNKDRGYKEGFYFCVGVFHISKNDKSIILKNRIEDLEHTLISYKKYGNVIRCCDILFKTKFYGKGGLDTSRREHGYIGYYKNFINLQYEYSKYMTASTKKIKLFKYPAPHFRLNIKDREVITLPKIDPEIFNPLLQLLSTHLLKLKKAHIPNIKNKGDFRENFPEHRADVFGYVKMRPNCWDIHGKYNLSNRTKKYPELYNELKRIGNILVPFKWSSVLVNNNVVCGKHVDASNIGESLLISIGSYDGCNIVVNNKKYDSKYQPLIFNGSKLEHYTTDDLVGNKYSLVFYNIVPDDYDCSFNQQPYI
jgi:hypothetical protein